MSYVKFCKNCNYTMYIDDTFFQCSICFSKEKIQNNEVVYKIFLKKEKVVEKLQNPTLEKYDIYKKTKLSSKCKKCQSYVGVMVSNEFMNSKIICQKCGLPQK